jgi:hypothetical protein
MFLVSHLACIEINCPPHFLTKPNRNTPCTAPLEKEKTMKPLSLLLALLLLCTNSTIAFAQQPANAWSNVQQIRTNEKLLVRQKNGKEFKGEMIEATDTTLTIDRDGKPFSIPRTDVRQVYVTEGKAEKGKWTAIGAGIGAGTGAGIGAIKYSDSVDDSRIYVVMGLLIGTGAGAVGGLLFGQSRRNRTMVYDAR